MTRAFALLVLFLYGLVALVAAAPLGYMTIPIDESHSVPTVPVLPASTPPVDAYSIPSPTAPLYTTYPADVLLPGWSEPSSTAEYVSEIVYSTPTRPAHPPIPHNPKCIDRKTQGQ